MKSKYWSCEATFLLKLHLLHALICSSRWGVTGCVNRYTHEEVSEIPKVLEHFRKSAANYGLRAYSIASYFLVLKAARQHSCWSFTSHMLSFVLHAEAWQVVSIDTKEPKNLWQLNPIRVPVIPPPPFKSEAQIFFWWCKVWHRRGRIRPQRTACEVGLRMEGRSNDETKGQQL